MSRVARGDAAACRVGMRRAGAVRRALGGRGRWPGSAALLRHGAARSGPRRGDLAVSSALERIVAVPMPAAAARRAWKDRADARSASHARCSSIDSVTLRATRRRVSCSTQSRHHEPDSRPTCRYVHAAVRAVPAAKCCTPWTAAAPFGRPRRSCGLLGAADGGAPAGRRRRLHARALGAATRRSMPARRGFARFRAVRALISRRRVSAHDGALAERLPGFHLSSRAAARWPRSSSQALESGRHAAIEAGTGIGKTFAYLLPVLLSERRAIISTGTRTLQDQLFARDLPLLGAVVGRPAARRAAQRPQQLPVLASARDGRATTARATPPRSTRSARCRVWGQTQPTAAISPSSRIWPRITRCAAWSRRPSTTAWAGVRIRRSVFRARGAARRASGARS